MIPRELINSEEHALLPRLQAAIGCPIDWSQVPSVAQRYMLAKKLRIYWTKVAELHQSDMEMHYYSRLHVEESLKEESLRAIEANAKVWRRRAEDDYVSKVGFLQTLGFATWTEYDKHRPPPSASRERVLRLTQPSGTRSLFFEDGVIAHCEELLWEALGDDLIHVAEHTPPHLFVESKQELGACEGLPTKVMRLDIDYDTPQVHGHPRPAPPNQKLLGASYFDTTFIGDEYNHLLSDIDEPRVKDYDRLWQFAFAQRKQAGSQGSKAL
jgi:hypothetical protein